MFSQILVTCFIVFSNFHIFLLVMVSWIGLVLIFFNFLIPRQDQKQVFVFFIGIVDN